VEDRVATGLHIITVPALIGGLGTPSVIDGPPLEPGSLPVPLRAIDVQVGLHGSIWAHYEVLERRSGSCQAASW